MHSTITISSSLILVVNNFLSLTAFHPNSIGLCTLFNNSTTCNTLLANSNPANATSSAITDSKSSLSNKSNQIIGEIPRIRIPELQLPDDFQVVSQVPLSSGQREIVVASASTGTEQVYLTSLPGAEKLELYGVEFKNVSGIDLRPLLVGSNIELDAGIESTLKQFKIAFNNNSVSKITLANGESAVFEADNIILKSATGKEIDRFHLTTVNFITKQVNIANEALNKFEHKYKQNLNLLAQSSSCQVNASSSLQTTADDIAKKRESLQLALNNQSSKAAELLTLYSLTLDFTSKVMLNQAINSNLQETICKPPVQCNEQVVAGKSEIRTDLFQVPPGTTNRGVSLAYEFYEIPDKLEMFYDGKKIFEVDPTSGSDRKTFVLPNTAKLVGVRLIGNTNKNTEWNYKISCSGETIVQNTIPISENPEPTKRKPKDLCADPRYRRLLDEKLPNQAKEKLDRDPHRVLQPLGTYRLRTASDPLSIKPDFIWANYDEYKITIPQQKLPNKFNPKAFLQTWASNMNAAPIKVDKQQFDSVNVFQVRPSNYVPQLGDVIGINIKANPIEGRADVMITDIQPTYFKASTLTYLRSKPKDGRPPSKLPLLADMHPVSGSREFGFESNPDGSVTFYTRGLDSPTWLVVKWLGVPQQRKGWTGFMQGIGERFGLSSKEAKHKVDQESFNDKIDKEPACHIKP